MLSEKIFNFQFSIFKYILIFFVGILVPASVLAAPLTLRHNHHIFTLYPASYDWQGVEEEWLYNGSPIRPPSHFRVDGDSIPPLPEGFERREVLDWNRSAIASTIRSVIGPRLERDAGEVVISRTATGVVFDGVGMLGREIDTSIAADLTIHAIKNDVNDIVLPVHEIQPSITVNDSNLRSQGITQVVTVGESDFSGSPWARRHNIATGLDKFNGHIIPKGETFSFNEILGPVNGATGYLKELVIHGDKTIPDYGGGLCQVSTTAYRGVWEYGFPIDARRNHSYAVNYYSPSGTDATIYPPHTDMKFVNDSPGDLLIQTHFEDSKAYFIYYGTQDGRYSEVAGPFNSGSRAPPPDKTEYTTEIPAGTTRVVGKPVPGIKSSWYRIVRKNNEELVENFFSAYEARPLFTQIGVETLPGDTPSWIGGDSAVSTPEPEPEPRWTRPSRRR